MSDVHTLPTPTGVPARSRRRRAVGTAILVAIACAGFCAYRHFTTLEIPEPFDVAGYVAYTLPDEENAFTYYLRAVEKLVSEDAVFAGNPSFKRDEFWQSWNVAAELGWDHAVPSLRQWVTLNRPLLAELNRGAECAESLEFPLADAATANALSVNWSRLRTCFQLQTLEGLRLTAEHHPVAAWDCFRNTLRSSRHLAMQAGSIETLFGTAIGDQAARSAVIWAADPSVGPTDLRRAIQDLLAVEEMRAPASDQIKLEYLALRASAEKGTIGSTPTRPWVRATGYPMQIGLCARMVVANLLSQADRPKYQRTAVHPGELHLFELDPAAPQDPKLLPPQAIEAASANSANTLAHVLKPILPDAAQQLEYCDPPFLLGSLWQASLWRDASQAHRSALLLALALELYYREDHEFPATLQDLVAKGELKSIPLDPFGTGEPYHYRRETPAERGATLWSVYTDGIDDGGADLRDGKGDLVLHVPAPGTNNQPKNHRTPINTR
jgi:hypothetical protein